MEGALRINVATKIAIGQYIAALCQFADACCLVKTLFVLRSFHCAHLFQSVFLHDLIQLGRRLGRIGHEIRVFSAELRGFSCVIGIVLMLGKHSKPLLQCLSLGALHRPRERGHLIVSPRPYP